MNHITTVAIVGLGSRGKDAYAQALKAMPDKARITAIADTDPAKVREVAQAFSVPVDRCFDSAEALLAQDKLADVLIICTQDRPHVPHAIPALEKGYDILMEKPISPDLQQCRALLETAHRTGRKVVVCHVLRYSPFYRRIKAVLDGGVLGELQAIQGIENVTYWHQVHSFVRGNWRNSETTSPMFLAKCCHDMDLMVWLTGRNCVKVSSFGSLGHFTPDHAPKGAAKRCLDGCHAKANCPYDAEKIYITNPQTGIAHGKDDWPCNILALYPTMETIRQAIETGPYGRCVYFCDNNVVDHQVVNLEMEGGLTVNFTMCAFTADGGRTTKSMGTHGSMIADMSRNTIEVRPFDGEITLYDFNLKKERMTGHAGGDTVLMEEFLDYIQGKTPDGITSLDASMESHFICMAAEESRVHGGMCVEMEQIRKA